MIPKTQAGMENKKTKILKAALKLFTKYGFRETTTSQIAREAGVANGTLFHYFPTKDDIIETLFLLCSLNAESYNRRGLENYKSIKGKFMQLLHNWLNFALEHTEQYLFINMYLTSSYLPQDEKILVFSEFIEKIIEPGERQKLFKDGPPELILEVTCNLLHILIVHFLNNRQKASDPEYVERALSFICDSVSNPHALSHK